MPKRIDMTFFYYLGCGGLATIFDWASFYTIAYIVKWNYIIAVSVSFIIGSTTNYILNRHLTFNNNFSNIPLQYGVFLLGATSALILTYIQMIILVEYLHIDRMASRVFITGIMLFYNFGFHKVYTFGKLR